MYLKQVNIHSTRFPLRNVYPFSIPVMGEEQELRFHKPVAFFVGGDGTGKSTLLDAIARKCGIHVWDKPRRHQAHNNPYETALKDYVATTWTNGRVSGSLFRAETFRDLSDFLDDVALCDPGRLAYHGGRILNTLSHGQGILSYFRGRLGVKGIYFLDEPEAALSPKSQVELLHLLHDLESQGHVQFIITTHSPILLAHPGAQIFSFDGDRIKEVAYEETAHYRLYRQFFLDRSRVLESDQRRI